MALNTISLIEQFEQEHRTTYRNEQYRVRDNGAVFREARLGKPKRPLDNLWTFGSPNNSTGYMHIGTEVVHRIVATAFHGAQPSERHIVDHIDTNRRNNRPANLHWITRLDNVINNPVTRRKIEIAYGSLEAFFKDPRNPINAAGVQTFEWMRTVTKEEAEQSRERWQKWAASGATPGGGSVGSWIYGDRPALVAADVSLDVSSPTPNVIQRRWRTPTTFEQCPGDCNLASLAEYAKRLTPGSVFARNDYGESLVVMAEHKDAFISVVSQQPKNSVKGWAVARVTVEDGKFIHEAMGTFFGADGAEKKHCELLGKTFEGETFDDYC